MPLNEELALNQTKVRGQFNNGGFVPVFALSSNKRTSNVRDLIYKDTIAKAEALIAGGATVVEFLNRGDGQHTLHEYTDQLLAAIKHLARKHPNISFGVGTIANAEVTKTVATVLAQLPMKNGFMVTAHQADEDMLSMASKLGVTIISTISGSKSVELLGKDGQPTTDYAKAYTVKPGSNNTDVIDVEYMKTMRRHGMNIFKIFDAAKIGQTRAGTKVSDDERTLYTVIATAEALIASYDGKAPDKEQFYVMGTGGLNFKTFPLAIAAAQNPELQKQISEILKNHPDAEQILDVIKRTTFATGGTFITTDYDKAISASPADETVAQVQKEKLVSLMRDCKMNEQLAKQGVVASIAAAQKDPALRKTLIIGEPLEQYHQHGDKPRFYVGTAGDSYNFAITSAALAEKYGNQLGKLYFATGFGGTAQEPHPQDEVFINNLKAKGIDTNTFSTFDPARHVGSYTTHYDAEGKEPLKGQNRNSYDRENAASRFFFNKQSINALKERIIREGITQIVASHISLGNCADRESQLEFLNFAKQHGVNVLWADNYRTAVWKDAAEAAKYSALAMGCVTEAIVSFDDESKMHGDKNPHETAKRILSYGVREVTVTNEGKAVVVATAAEGIKEVMPATLENTEKHTAGAGDCFAAMYKHQRTAGVNKQESAWNASLVARRVMSMSKDNLDAKDLPEKLGTRFELPAHPAVVSVRYFYRIDPKTGELDPAEEKILEQIKAAKGIHGITTSLHSKERTEAFTAWEIVKLIRHVEYNKVDNDPIESYAQDETGALQYLEWLRSNGKATGLTIMNFEDSRTANEVKYGDEATRDKAIDVEIENFRVLSACGMNTEDRPGFCYTTNFMTPFDWFRTEMDYELPDGSKAMAIKAELLCMFDRYIVNIEPKTSGYYKHHYSPEVLAKAEKLWESFAETDQAFQNNRKLESFKPEIQQFIASMLKGHAGSSEGKQSKSTLELFREQVKDSRYLGQDKETACFENDVDGSKAHNKALQNLEYYAKRLNDGQQALGNKSVKFVLHPDDTADTLDNRGDLGVFRVVSTVDDIVHLYESGIGENACTGCWGSARGVVLEADVAREAIEKIRELHPQADLTYFMPFLHLRKVVKAEESLDTYSTNPAIRQYLQKIQADLGHTPGSIAELPHHVALTPLFRTLEVLNDNNMLWDVRPDHTTTLPFHLDYTTGEIKDEHLGRPGYDITRIMSGQQIRIMLDALHNLETFSAREFVRHFEDKLCSFGLEKAESYKDILGYLRNLDFGMAMTEYQNERGFEPVFKNPEVANGIVQANAVSCNVTQLSEQQRVAAARSAAA